jgi:hypothetical protein
MHAKADTALSPTIKPLASRLPLPPEHGQKHQVHCRLPLPDLMLVDTVKLGESGPRNGRVAGETHGNGFETRATRTIAYERGWLRPNFIAVCLDETEDRAQQPRNPGNAR